MSHLFILVAFGAGASALGGALGMASGIFIVPLLTLGLGVPIRQAVAASLASVIACSCGSAAAYLKAGLTNVRLAAVLETATTLGATIGVLLSGLVSTRVLYGLFAIILVLSAWQMRRERKSAVAGVEAHGRGWRAKLDGAFPGPDGMLQPEP